MGWIQSYINQWDWWETIGWAGQALFFSRFLLQWVVSERVGRSVIPFHFWTISIVGSLVLMVYLAHAYVHKGAGLPILAGQGIALFVYGRNMALVKRARKPGAKP